MSIAWLVNIGVVMGVILSACAYLIYVERKLAAYMQDRIGPNRVGPFGLLQPLADGLKFLLKEDVIPRHADRVLFVLAPCIALLTTMLAFAVVPFGPTSNNPDDWQFVIAPRVDIGIVFIFAVGSLAVYSIILGGWSSNNKYSLLGALRSSAQVISYEIPLATSVLGVVLMSGTLNLERMVHYQAERGFWGWNAWAQPLAMLIFMVSALAEANRLPFDLPEAEQELIGGYHTEYSAMKFAMFFLGEYTHVITISFLVSVVFFGGWHFPWIAEPDSAYVGAWLVKCGVLAAKATILILFIMFIRWTVPRFRFDQLMTLAWQGLVPLAFTNVLLVMMVKQFGWPILVLPITSIGLFVCAVAANGIMLQRRLRGPRLAAAK
jgi:NADH-quinone oxidoreductase subunit H